MKTRRRYLLIGGIALLVLSALFVLGQPALKVAAQVVQTPTRVPVVVTTGWFSPSANAAVTSNAGDNNGYESNPTKVYADDGIAAGDYDSGSIQGYGDCTSSITDQHIFSNFNINIPTGATILGIEVRADAYRTGASAGYPYERTCIKMSTNGGSTWTTATDVTFSIATELNGAEKTYIQGSSTDLWFRSWVPADFSNTNFRIYVGNYQMSSPRPNLSVDYFLEYLAIRVTYRY